MTHVAIRLLGHLSVTLDGKPWEFAGSQRTAEVLGYLVTHSGEPVSRVALASLMWPDSDSEDGRTKLRRQVYLLKDSLPPKVEYFDAKARSLRWAPSPPVWVDVLEFERAAQDPARTQEAIECYGGAFLENSYEDWALLERERLQAAFLKLCYDAALAARRRRDFDAMLAYAERILGVDEWREDALRLAMTARYDAGDRTGALAEFERFAGNLKREMNVDPMPETLVVRAAILQNAPLPGQREAGEDDDAGIPSPRARLAFVGRATEFDALSSAWQRAARGRGSTIFLSGPAGIGKSRLTAELVTHATGQGGRALFGGTSNPEAFPYEAIVDALRGSIALIAEPRIDRAWLASLSALLPELRGILPDLPPVEIADSQRARARLLEAVARIVESIAHARPLLLVIEDAHWAQQATFDAIEAIARRIGALPVLILVTYRAEEVGSAHPLRALRKRLQAERRAARLSLGALARDDVETLVANVHPGAPAELAGTAYALSEGNPLFVVQILRGIAESGTLPDERSAARSIGGIILERIAGLDEGARAVAEAGATIGRSFTVDAAAEVLAWPEGDVADRLDLLLDRGILREAGATHLVYTFTHALIAASIYDAMPRDVRTARHRRIAQSFARAAEHEPVEPAMVARHWSLAQDRKRAAGWYLRAAQAALDVHAREEVVGYAHAARDHAGDDETRFVATRLAAVALDRAGGAGRMDREVAHLEELGESLSPAHAFEAAALRMQHARLLGNPDMMRGAVERLQAIAEKTGDVVQFVDAAVAYGSWILRLGKLEDATARLTAALSSALAIEDDERAMQVREQLVQALMRNGQVDAARTELLAMRAHVEKHGASLERRLRLLNPESIAAQVLESGPDLERVGKEMLEVAREANDTYFEARAHTVLAHSAYVCRDFAAVREHYARAIELFDAVGDRRSVQVTYNNRAEMYLRVGRADDALRDLDGAYKYFETSFVDSTCTTLANRAHALYQLGRFPEALEEARAALEASMLTQEPWLRADAAIALGTIEAASGLHADAIPHLEFGIAGCVDREDWSNAGNGECAIIDVFLALGDVARALAHAKALEETFAQHPGGAMHPSRICLALGRVAAARGRIAERDRWYERGLAELRAVVARFTDPADVAAYESLEFNKALVAARADVTGG